MTQRGQTTVERIIREHAELVDHLQTIAKCILEIRDESDMNPTGRKRRIYRPHDNFEYTVDIEDSQVQVSFYFAQNTHYFAFPLSYVWQDDYEARERQAIADKLAAAARRANTVEYDEKLAAEARDKVLYERLKARFEPGATATTG